MYATQEMTEDLALEDDDLPDGEILTGACGGLITVDNKTQAIHVIHYTVQQYFERCLGQKLMAARMSLTKVSLKYLALPNFSSGFCTSDAAMRQRLIMIELTSQVWSLPSARYPSWSQEFPRKCPALVLAAAFDLPVILQRMIADGHDIEGRGTDEETALIRAAAYGHAENVRILVQLGAAVDATDYMGETALQRAARNGHSGVLRVLIDKGADVNNKASSWTPLMSAVSSGNVDAVRMLVEAGADLMSETRWGDTALIMAVRSKQESIAAFLADHGAVLPRGVAGRRAFVIASQAGLQQLVRRLTINYEAVAENPLQRQSSHILSRLPERHKPPGESLTEAQASEEVPFGELMEQYDIKTNFHQQYKLIRQIEEDRSGNVHL
ncbi:hypothetical protein ZTR_02907 [Talaromyces verruculosus]|nr:hypothetical protein ZTR_02907 [Talaromyces verruculosus]